MTNLFLRLLTLGAKGVLIFFLASHVSVKDVGTYGLVAAVSGYLTFVFGAEFYSYSSRYFVGKENNAKYFAFKNHVVLSLVLYTISVPILAVLSVTADASWRLYLATLSIAVGEHVALEAQRYLNLTLRPVLASLLFFIRAGAWPLLAIGLLAAGAIHSIMPVLALWLTFLGVALASTLFILRRGIALTLAQPVSFSWLKSGVYVSVPLIVAALAIRALFTFDRVIVSLISSRELLAVYVVYASVMSAVISLADAGVIAFQFPLALHSAKRLDYSGVRKHGRIIMTQGAAATATFVIVSLLSLNFLAPHIGKQIYVDHLGTAWVLGVAAVLYVAGQGPQAVLFALHLDKATIIANLAGATAFLLSSLWLAHYSSAFAVPLASCVGFALILFMKNCYARRALRARDEEALVSG